VAAEWKRRRGRAAELRQGGEAAVGWLRARVPRLVCGGEAAVNWLRREKK